MTSYILITGTIFRSPERRTSKAGKPFTKATLKASDGDDVQFWNLLAFRESIQDELARLRDGDAVSVQGAFKAELYRPEDGEPRVSLSIVAERILPLRQADDLLSKMPRKPPTYAKDEHEPAFKDDPW
jgi:single-stranded DNA-binding protein